MATPRRGRSLKHESGGRDVLDRDPGLLWAELLQKEHALRVHVFGKALYPDLCRRLASPPNASMLFGIVVLLAVYAVVWFLYRRRWFLKF